MMVRKGRNRTRGRRRPIQTRSLTRTVGFEPIVTRGSQDPPQLKNSFLHHTTIPVTLQLGSTAGITPSTTGTVMTFSFVAPTSTTAGKITTYYLTPANLYAMWAAFTHSSDVSDECTIALKKASLWGIAHPYLTAVRVGLQLLQSLPFSTKSVSDVGTTNSRAKVFLSCPYNAWLDPTSTTNFLYVDPDVDNNMTNLISAAGLVNFASGQVIGDLHLTVAVQVASRLASS